MPQRCQVHLLVVGTLLCSTRLSHSKSCLLLLPFLLLLLLPVITPLPPSYPSPCSPSPPPPLSMLSPITFVKEVECTVTDAEPCSSGTPTQLRVVVGILRLQFRDSEACRLCIGSCSGVSVAVKRWHWPDAFAGVSKQDASNVRDAIAAMAVDPPAHYVTSANWAGHTVGQTLNIDTDDDAGKARIKELLNYWIKTDVLAVEGRQDNRNGRTKKVVLVGQNNPNSTNQL